MAETPNLHVEFFIEPVENKAKSREAGRPFYEDKEFVRIKFPGDNKRVLVAPADECAIRHPETGMPWSYKDRFSKHYEAFAADQEYFGEGTPLSELPFLSKSQAKMLRDQNVHTAEMLSRVDGHQITNFGMGGRDLVEKAKAYLAKADNGARNHELMRQNDEFKSRIEALEKMLAAQRGDSVEPANPFSDWESDDLKNWIKESGQPLPRGNPSQETLAARAQEINAMLEKNKEAA